MSMKFITVILLIFLFVSKPLKAQIYVELDSISVTASRISTDISESGKNVSVITSDDIEQMPVTSVDELLRSLPGVNINSRQGFGVQADVGIRGSTYSQVLFMLDNVPLNHPLTAHFNTNIPVALSEIGQIELIRGPASTSFGADAVGGVVHIKTKMYMEKNVTAGTNQDNVHVAADISAGQNRLQMADVSLGLQTDRWRFSTSMRSSRSDGESFPNPGYTENVSDEEFYNTFFDLMNLSAAVSHRTTENLSWYVRGGWDQREFNARYFYTRSIFDESVEEITNRWILSAVNYSRGNHDTEINVSYRNVDDRFDFNSVIAPVNEHTTGLFFINLSHQTELAQNSSRFRYVRLMAGGQYLDKQIESTDRGNHRDGMGGFYTIGTATFANGLSTTASLRLQFDALGRTDLLPQLSAAYNFQRVTIRSSAGRAVRVADFTERYISSAIPELTPLRNIGNPNLIPEKSTTYDVGIDWRPTDFLRISPTLFYRSSTNLIDYVLRNSSEITHADNLLADEDYFHAENITNSSTRGFELLTSSHMNVRPGTSVSIQTGYTYIRTTSEEGTVSRYIANHPSHQIRGGFQLAHSRFSLMSQAEYNVRSAEAEQLVDGNVPSSYFITHLKASASLYSGVRLYIHILNLTDTQYQEILGAPMPGRWAMGGLQVSL